MTGGPSKGGTLVVQYNVIDGFPGRESFDQINHMGPYPLKVSRSRITVEDAPVNIPNASHPLLQTPNAITQDDFKGWVQERGLYFADSWNDKYETPLSMHDPDEPPRKGSVLYVRHGKGSFIYTGLAFFRQLPAGVPGAYRLFSNMISNEP